MGEQTVGRVLPTGPGPWWVRIDDDEDPSIAHVWSQDGKFYACFPGEWGDDPVDSEGLTWLAPVAPIGSVPPEVYVRGVREAYTEGGQDVLAGCEWAGSDAQSGVRSTLATCGMAESQIDDIVYRVTP